MKKPLTSSPPRITVSVGDLPASCPQSAKWDDHPRVYIKLSPETPERACPYCGTIFILRLLEGTGR